MSRARARSRVGRGEKAGVRALAGAGAAAIAAAMLVLTGATAAAQDAQAPAQHAHASAPGAHVSARDAHGSAQHRHTAQDGPGAAPTTAFDEAGRLWVAFTEKGHVYVAWSDDDGRAFNTPVAVNTEPEALDVNGENRPKLAFGPGGEIYVTWTRKLPGGYNGEIRFSRSRVDAERGVGPFERPITLNDDGLATGHRFDSLHVREDGSIYVVWLDKRDAVAAAAHGEDYVGAAVYYTVSTNGGRSFAPNRFVAAHSCECCRIATADSAAEPGVAIFWRQVFGGAIRDHAFAVLGVDGVLSAPRRVTDDDWRIDACPHHGPAMIRAKGGGYHLAWFTGGNLRKGVYYARYTPTADGGLEREPGGLHGLHGRAPISASPSAGHADMELVGGSLFLAWKEFDGAATRVLLVRSSDGGASWSPARTIAATAGASDHPFLLSRDADVFLSWHTEREGLRIEAVAHVEDAARIRGAELSGPAEERPRPLPFGPASLRAIEERRAGQPFLAVLWSVDCAPCRRELELLGRVRQAHPELALVLISTDPPGAEAAELEVLANHGLEDVESWGFADANVERLRYSIDPGWFGELPRAYFYRSDGSRRGISGALEEDELLEWLAELPPSALMRGDFFEIAPVSTDAARF